MMKNLYNKGAAVVNRYPLRVVAGISAVLAAVVVATFIWNMNTPVGAPDNKVASEHSVTKNQHILDGYGSAGIGVTAPSTLTPNTHILDGEGSAGVGGSVGVVNGEEASTTKSTTEPARSKVSNPSVKSAPVITDNTGKTGDPVSPSTPLVKDEPIVTPPMENKPVVKEETVVSEVPVVPAAPAPSYEPVYVDWAYTPKGMTGSVLVSYRATPQADGSWGCAWKGSTSIVDGVAVQEWEAFGSASSVEACKDLYASL